MKIGYRIETIVFDKASIRGIRIGKLVTVFLEIGEDSGGVQPLRDGGGEIPLIAGVGIVGRRSGSSNGPKFGGFGGIEMDITGKVKKERLVLDQNSPIGTLEESARSIVFLIKIGNITGGYAANEFGYSMGGVLLYQEMEVVGHETVGEEFGL